MKKYILYLASVLALGQLSSCSDFLDEVSEDKFTTSTLFETPEGLEKMVLALYSYERDLTTRGNSNGFLGAHIFNERNTDLVVFTTGDDANIGRYTSPGPTSNINGLLYSPFWKQRYYIIGRANEMIYYGEKLSEEAKVPLAEAHFWRAYCYYGLWARFSRLYLTTEPVTKENLNDNIYVPADSADVFKLMYEDADKAIAGLPLTSDFEGRLTQDAARHLKALIAAWAKDWTEVKKQVEEVEKNGVHYMGATPADVFGQQNLYNHPEALFALHFSLDRGGKTHRIGSQYMNIIAESDYTHQLQGNTLVKYNTENLGKQWGLAYPNSYLMSLYPEDDKRLTAYYKIDYTYQNPNKLITVPVAELKTDDKTGRTYYTTTNHSGEPYKVKVGDVIYGRDIYAATDKKLDRRNILPSSIKMYDKWNRPLDSSLADTRDIIVYRLAETFLLGAEACMHLNDQEGARYYYNKSWERAGNDAVTGDVTFDMIRDEQARELAFEGRRWDFLKRNGIWYNQMRSYAGDFTKYPADNVGYKKGEYGVSDGRDANFGPNPDYYIDFNGSDNDVKVRFNVLPTHVNWPIPQDQIDAMGAENFPQNEGY